jgi:glucuronoarabinoxylan endo-1,4-beta-xylanase
MPETSNWTSSWASFTSLASTTMEDPAAAAYVGINAWHDYDNSPLIFNPFAPQGKKFWETEVSSAPGFGPSLCGGCWDPSIADALMWAQIVNNRMTVSNANAWNYWELIGTDYNGGLGQYDGEVLNASGFTVAKRAYMLGNYSRFVRPGFYRIDATPMPRTGVLVSAYKSPANTVLVVVVINQNGSAVSQNFTLNGASVSSVTPWITSSSLNLTQEPEVEVSGGSFSYVLPAYSITSFVSSTTTGSLAIAPPTRLTGTVR